MDLYEQIKEKFLLTENMYDCIRIVDPINKDLVIIKDNEIKKNMGTCYDLWKMGVCCNNCISMRAYTEKDTFVKIEYDGNNVVLVTAVPVFIDEEKYFVIEMLKDISQNGRIFDTNNDANVCAIINEMNERIKRDGLKDLDKKIYEANIKNRNQAISDKYIKVDDNKLSILSSKIEELRDTLNEMCISSDEISGDNEKLKISEYLDELIVEYMKKIYQFM